MRSVFLTVTFLSVSSFAALPPLYQTAQDIAAVVSDTDLLKAIGNETVDPIAQVSRRQLPGGDWGYQVSTEDCSVAVSIVYKKQPPGFAGPSIIEKIQHGKVVCR